MARAMTIQCSATTAIPRIQVNRPAELSAANSGALARFLHASPNTLSAMAWRTIAAALPA
jgi:hypothetical protein